MVIQFTSKLPIRYFTSLATANIIMFLYKLSIKLLNPILNFLIQRHARVRVCVGMRSNQGVGFLVAQCLWPHPMYSNSPHRISISFAPVAFLRKASRFSLMVYNDFTNNQFRLQKQQKQLL